MILVYKDKMGKWHLVKSLGKAGIASIGIYGHCGEDGGADRVVQVPDNQIKMICGKCREIIENLS